MATGQDLSRAGGKGTGAKAKKVNGVKRNTREAGDWRLATGKTERQGQGLVILSAAKRNPPAGGRSAPFALGAGIWFFVSRES